MRRAMTAPTSGTRGSRPGADPSRHERQIVVDDQFPRIAQFHAEQAPKSTPSPGSGQSE
jgi:hypothetical protein